MSRKQPNPSAPTGKKPPPPPPPKIGVGCVIKDSVVVEGVRFINKLELKEISLNGKWL